MRRFETSFGWQFRRAAWLLPCAFALHEAEEWNIVAWYQRYWIDLPALTNASAWSWQVFISLVGFLWTWLATLARAPRTTAFAVLVFAILLVLQNALQHVYWLFLFDAYAPGVITSVFLLIPVSLYLIAKAIRDRLLAWWYVVALLALMTPGLIATVESGNALTPQIRAIHEFAVALARLL